MTKERNCSLDALRILCMFMIVISHSLVHSGVYDRILLFSGNYFLTYTLHSFIYIMVNCFVLISGYFLCEGTFKTEKLLKLWIDVFFWSFLLTLLFILTGSEPFQIKTMIKAMLPITQSKYWFSTSYILMYLMVPVLNAAIHHMNKKQHFLALSTFFCVFIVLQNVIFWRNFTTINGNSPFFFAFLYMTAAFIRLYPPQIKRSGKYFILYMICSAITALSRFIMTAITVPFFGEPLGETILLGYSSITVVLASVFIFLAFLCMEIKPLWLRKLIVFLSPLTFGIYLIHDQEFVRKFIWQHLFHPQKFTDSYCLIPYLLLISICIFIVCVFLELIRTKLFGFLGIHKICRSAAEKIDCAVQKFTACITEKCE